MRASFQAHACSLPWEEFTELREDKVSASEQQFSSAVDLGFWNFKTEDPKSSYLCGFDLLVFTVLKLKEKFKNTKLF